MYDNIGGKRPELTKQACAMWGLDDGEKFALGSLDEQRRWQSAYRSMIDAMTGPAAG